MILREEVFVPVCDCCKKNLETEDCYYPVFPSKDEAVSAALNACWADCGDELFCDECWHRDDNDNIAIKDGRVYSETEEKWIKEGGKNEQSN